MGNDPKSTSNGSRNAGSPFEGQPCVNCVNYPCSRNKHNDKRSEQKLWINHTISIKEFFAVQLGLYDGIYDLTALLFSCTVINKWPDMPLGNFHQLYQLDFKRPVCTSNTAKHRLMRWHLPVKKNLHTSL